MNHLFFVLALFSSCTYAIDIYTTPDGNKLPVSDLTQYFSYDEGGDMIEIRVKYPSKVSPYPLTDYCQYFEYSGSNVVEIGDVASNSAWVLCND